MKTLITIMVLPFVWLAGVIAVQQPDLERKNQAIVVPQDIYFLMTVPQPDCPLQFEKTLVVKYMDRQEAELYRVRNRGPKPIRSYTYATLTSTDLGSVYSWPQTEANILIMPDELAPRPDKIESLELVSLTEELRDKLKLRGRTREAVIFMILNVEFADGSQFDDTPRYNRIREHVQQLKLLEKADDPNFDAEQSIRSIRRYIESVR